MDITFSNADEYFAIETHIDAGAWTAFAATQRSAAVETARRQLERALRRPLGSGKYDDKACYEQALWLLKTHTVADGSGAMPYPVANDAEMAEGAAPLPLNRKQFADEALRWLGWTGSTTIRG